MKNQIRNMFSVLAITLASFSAHATVVYDGGIGNGSNGFLAETDYDYTQAATLISLSSGVTSNSITWWGTVWSSGVINSGDNFTLSIYQGSGYGSTPGSLLHTFSLGTGNGVSTGNLIYGSTNEYVYQASYSDLTLGAGDYFIALSNSNNYHTTSGNAWIWETTSGGQQLAGASLWSYSGSWVPNQDENLAFQLNHNVPEPATIALMCIGLLGLASLRRNRTC